MRKKLFFAGMISLGVMVGPGQPGAQLISNPNFTQPPAKDGESYPEYFCTDSEGKRVELGQTTCLTIGARQVLALCEISVNSPAWREQTESCPDRK